MSTCTFVTKKAACSAAPLYSTYASVVYMLFSTSYTVGQAPNSSAFAFTAVRPNIPKYSLGI